MSITKMRAEIEKGGAGFFAGWKWHLRLTDDVTNPVIPADNPITLIRFGTATREEALNHHDTLLMFPVCWQACLVASRQELEGLASMSPEMQGGI